MSESPLHAGLTHLPDVKGKIPGKMRKGEKMGDLRFFSSFFFVPFFCFSCGEREYYGHLGNQMVINEA